MSYRRHSYIALALFTIAALLRQLVLRVVETVVLPIFRFIRDTPVSAVMAKVRNVTVDALRRCGLLKPVYRESLDTHGLSLPSVRD